MRGSLFLGLFVAGATGGIMHCAPMCGGFVLGQVSDRMARLPAARLCEWQRFGNGLLWPYHAGRLTTYSGLGAVAAGSAALFGRAAWFGHLSAVLLILAALLFLTGAFRRALPFLFGFDHAPTGWSRFLGRFTRLIPRGSPKGEFLLGLALGFLPCGLLYAALAAAAAAGGPLEGAGAMAAFGLGTVPSLFVVGIAGQAAGRRWSRGIAVAAPVIMIANAVLLLALAWERMA